MKRYLLILLVAFLLSACTPSDTNLPYVGPSQTEGSSGVEGVPVIDFERQGGITGIAETYQIFSDGTIRLADGSTRSVDRDALANALTAIDAAGFFDLSIPPLTGTCNDCYTYTISVRHNNKTNTVTATDNGELPESFWNVLDEITKLATSGD